MTPLLIYDGDCEFCAWWVRYWQQLTGPAVRYAPYQDVAHDYPQTAPQAFRRAVQYVASDGGVAAGAEASFRVLAHARGRGYALWLYRHLPGFAFAAERAYAFVATHRGLAFRASRLLWGPERVAPRLEATAAHRLRALALIYLAAFVSFGVQVAGLVGSHGLLPLPGYLDAVRQRFAGIERFWLFPSVFWLDASDAALRAACWAGAAASLPLLLFGRFARASLAAMFALYLSLFYAGQTFMSFQWDLLLLEAGAIALVLCRHPALLVWTVRWLVFRLMLMSGLVKWLGDASWHDMTALRYHFQTQPLPTPAAWAAARLPGALLGFAAAATLVVELLLPWLMLLPRNLRFVAAFGTIGFQLVIVATGNYGFFNLLVIALCIALFDDAAWRRVLPRRPAARTASAPRRVGLALAFAAFSVLFGTLQLAVTVRESAWLDGLLELVAPLRIVNRYGPFKVMTRERPEIVIEGTRDGEHWREIGFRYKPGDVRKAPGWNIPHQPRLDWQMWFAALGTQAENPWFSRLMQGLLRGTPEVLALLGDNPFPAAPPLAVRAQLYDYRFANAAERAAGRWWVRRPIGLYYPETRLPP
jgi:predicted DCC family thiol-disulfide oxidoreductase YuxK